MIERIDLAAMSTTVCAAIGPWRKPTSLSDARTMTDTIIDNLDQEWLLRFGLDLLGVPEATDYVLNDWKSNRRKPLRTHRPYFIHMLSINIFFALVLQTATAQQSEGQPSDRSRVPVLPAVLCRVLFARQLPRAGSALVHAPCATVRPWR